MNVYQWPTGQCVCECERVFVSFMQVCVRTCVRVVIYFGVCVSPPPFSLS